MILFSLFSFILNSTWTTDPAGDSQQVVNLTVKPYVVTGVIFLINRVQVAAVVEGAFAIGITMMNFSPPSGLYSIINLLQMIILFLND